MVNMVDKFFKQDVVSRREKLKKNLNFSTKLTISQKIEIASNRKLIFHAIQHIPHLSCEFENFEN